MDNRENPSDHKYYYEQKFIKVSSGSKRCYTCKPRGKVKKHIIGASLCDNFLFHHDMNHRPIILVTPIRHYTSIEEIYDVKAMFVAIKDFCSFWNIHDYQVSYNCGSWKAHDHFHLKIKINEKIAGRMRGDHFRRLQLEENYKKAAVGPGTGQDRPAGPAGDSRSDSVPCGPAIG
jgi:hypothetical protein